MVKIFKEADRTTVVFPKVENSEEVIERIIKEVYGENENRREVEIKGLVTSKLPPKADGVQVIDRAPKHKSVRTNQILKDNRNPFPGKLPYEIFEEKGVRAMLEYAKMRLSSTKADVQISKELFSDFKRYLKSLDNDYMASGSLDEMKDLILVISTKIYPVPMRKITNSLAIGSVESFLAEADEMQLRSAACKVVSDTIKYLS